MFAIFVAVNTRIIDFTDWKSKVTLINLVGSAGALIGTLVAFSGGLDWVVPRLLAYLTGNQFMLTVWPAGDHWGTKVVVWLAVLLLFYLLVFSFQAAVLMSEQKPVAGAAPADYRAEFARAIGINFTRVRDYYDVLNLNGDCHVILEAAFEVDHLPISHIERKFNSSSATGRQMVEHEAQVNPPGPRVDKDFKIVGKESVYHFRFTPALGNTLSCFTKITEDVTKSIFMFADEVTEDPVLGGKLEAVGHLVQEPTNQLELQVKFPYAYLVKGDHNCRVRLGSTETAHQKEELKLRGESAVSSKVVDGRQELKLVVNQPLMGLCYFLCWLAPERVALLKPNP